MLKSSYGGSGMVATWSQHKGILATSGDLKQILLWDAACEMTVGASTASIRLHE
jgi:hypothetical protein